MEVLIQLWWEQSSRRSKMITVKYTTSYYQTPIIHLQLKQDYYHHHIGLKPGKKEGIHTVEPTMMQSL
jgi:hypothetical protein